MPDLTVYRKLIVAVVGAISEAVALGLVPDEVGNWLAVAVTFLTLYGIYKVPNDVPIRKD